MNTAQSARFALNLMKNMNLHSSTYDPTTFADMKKAAQGFGASVREAVVTTSDDEAKQAMIFITGVALSRTFSGWADLEQWLKAVEVELERLVEATASRTGRTIHVRSISTGRVRRFTEGQTDAANTEMVDGDQWVESSVTVGQCRASLVDGDAFLCDAHGDPLQRLEGHLLGRGAVREGEGRDEDAEATDPATGFTYRVDRNGAILSRPAGGSSFCAAPCTVRIIQTLITLGLVEVNQ